MISTFLIYCEVGERIELRVHPVMRDHVNARIAAQGLDQYM